MIELLRSLDDFKPQKSRGNPSSDILTFVNSGYPFARVQTVDMYKNPRSCASAYGGIAHHPKFSDIVGVAKRGNDVYLYRKDMLQP